MSNKRERAAVEVALETADGLREAAIRAEHVARRLLRRTRLLAHRASRGPTVPSGELPDAADKHITLALPPSQPASVDERAQQLIELVTRAEQAEHAASWLRARLRAERKRTRKNDVPPIDAAALATDLTRDLARLPTYSREAVGRVVQRVLAAHGLPIVAEHGARAGKGLPVLPGWPPEQQEAVAAQAVARTPDISDPFYVYRILAIVGERGRSTLAQIARASGLESSMARRRLRLAAEALAALGAITVRDGLYTLNPDYLIPGRRTTTLPRPPHRERGERARTGPAQRRHTD